MKTRIEWRNGTKTLKIEESQRFPEIGAVISVNGGNYRVASIESAVVLVEPAAEDAVGPVTRTAVAEPIVFKQAPKPATKTFATEKPEPKKSLLASFVPSKKKK